MEQLREILRSVGKAPVVVSILALGSAGISASVVPTSRLLAFAAAGFFSVSLLTLSLHRRSSVTASGTVSAVDSSRRSLLAGGVAALGAAGASIGLLPGSASARPSAPRGSRAMKLRGRNWRYRKESERGNCYGELLNGRGKKVGDFYSTNMGLNAPFEDDSDFSGMEFHVFSLVDGSIYGMGSGAHSEESAYSVLGGTGSYAGRTGSYHGKQHSLELGGDGSAEFTFSLSR